MSFLDGSVASNMCYQFFLVRGFEKTLRFGIIISIAFGGHVHLNLHDVLLLIVPSAIDAASAHRGDEWKRQLLPTCLLNYRMSLLKGSLPNAFLAACFPKPIAHKSVPTPPFVLLLMEPLRSLQEERPLLHTDHTPFASMKPHCSPNDARGKSEPDAFHRSPVDGPRFICILYCEPFRSSLSSFGRLFF